jgi:DNA-binding CsgD family transcriptional regulator
MVDELTQGFGELERFKAVRADAESRERIDLGGLWRELTNATLVVRDCFFTQRDCLIAVEAKAPERRTDRRLLPKKLRVLERVLLRGGQKAVAAELGLAPSTVAIIAGGCLRAMGMDCGASRAPLPLWLSVHALHRNTPYHEARFSRVTHGEQSYTILGVPRPELRLEGLVSRAEADVIKLLIEGLSHAEMAKLRHTSVRTVANQLAAAFHKLGVSGRSELLCGLIATQSDLAARPRFAPVVAEREASLTRLRAANQPAIAGVVNG